MVDDYQQPRVVIRHPDEYQPRCCPECEVERTNCSHAQNHGGASLRVAAAQVVVLETNRSRLVDDLSHLAIDLEERGAQRFVSLDDDVHGTTQDVSAQAAWASANPTIAIVSGTGLVTGVATGDVDVRATYQNFTGAKSITIGSGIACAFSVSPTSVNVRAIGEPATFTVTVTQGSNCSWTSVSNSSFITVTSGGTGTGNGTVVIAVAANNDVFRSGSMTIAGRTIAVTQDAAGICVSSTTPTSQSFTSAGGTGTVTLIAPDTCGWHVTSNDAFISVPDGTRGGGNGTFPYTVAANTSTAPRQGTLSIGGRLFTVSQNGNCTDSVQPTSVTIDGSARLDPALTTLIGGPPITLALTQTGSCAWAAASDAPDWLKVTASGNGSATINVSAFQNNTGTSRTGNITVAGLTIPVTQTACAFSLSPSSVVVGASATDVPYTAQSTPAACLYNFNRTTDFLIVPFQSIGFTGTNTVTISVPQNLGAARSETLKMEGRDTTNLRTLAATSLVSQLATACITTSLTGVSVGASGGTTTVSVTNACSATWSPTTTDSFLTITSVANGGPNGSFTFNVQANTTGAARTGTIRVGDVIVTVTQSG